MTCGCFICSVPVVPLGFSLFPYAMEPFLSGVCFFVSSGSDHAHSLHVLLLVAILDGRPVIGDDAVVVPRIVEQVMRFIIADEEHAVLVGEPGEILAAVLELPARADDNVAQVDGRPERDRPFLLRLRPRGIWLRVTQAAFGAAAGRQARQAPGRARTRSPARPVWRRR